MSASPNQPANILQPKPTQTDVSPRALAIARQIDRLQQGSYIIALEKIDDKSAQWNVVIDGTIRVREFKAFLPTEDR